MQRSTGFSWGLVVSVVLAGLPSTLVAAEAPRRGVIEEVVVTALRQESSLQDTAVAVSAFDQDALNRQNIDDALDVQLAVPNLSFTKGNFTGSNIRIRGIGNNAVGASSDSGTAIAFNGAYLQTSSIFESEFFDVERVEVLRGPQGTLYGRNTTGGVVNIIPAKARLGEYGASIDLQAGNYDTRRANGMVNVPLGERAALRLSGMLLQRDGYVDNVATGEEYDDRDLWSTRVALNLAPTDSTEINFFWQRFKEDDQRMRTSNQTCEKDPRPYPLGLGCLPGADIESFGTLNSSAQLGGILAYATTPPLLTPFQDAFADTVRPTDLREVAADVAPLYQMDEDIYNLEITQDWGDYTFVVSGTYQEIELYTETDYDWAIPNFSNPQAGGASTFTPNVPSLGGTAGFTDADGVLTTPADPTVSGFSVPYAYDVSAFENEAFTAEARVISNWDDKPFDFLAGFFYLTSENSTIYDVRGNTLAALNPFGEFAPGPNGRPAPLSYFRSDTDEYLLDTWALFGEFYVDLSEDTRLTIGLRYSEETKEVSDRQSLLNNPLIPYEEGVSNRAFLDQNLEALVGTGGLLGLDIDDPRFYGYGTTGNNPVPPYRQFKDDWNELTGKIGIDHYFDFGFTDESMVFLTLARSYKSGGINPPSNSGAFEATFEPEFINSIEIGAKNRLFDNAMQVNGTWFFYDYEDLQNTKIVDRTSVNENIDSEIMGVELELSWAVTDRLRVDAFATWLDTEITSGTSIDPADPTGGNADWFTLKNGGADVFIVPEEALGNLGYVFDQSQCGVNNLECASIFTENPAVSAGGGGVTTQQTLVPIGFASDLSGNQLPGASEWAVKIGAEYSFDIGRGMELVPRIDWYWQDDFYYRVWNTNQDKIDAWSVTNAAVTLYGNDGSWYVEAFIKNIANDDFITGGYFTDASSGNFTNVFVLEPQTWGATFGYRM